MTRSTSNVSFFPDNPKVAIRKRSPSEVMSEVSDGCLNSREGSNAPRSIFGSGSRSANWWSDPCQRSNAFS